MKTKRIKKLVISNYMKFDNECDLTQAEEIFENKVKILL